MADWSIEEEDILEDAQSERGAFEGDIVGCRVMGREEEALW